MVCRFCCSRCWDRGCWEGCCCCFAAVMSPGKCLSIVPMWPLLAIILLSIGAGILLLGCEKFYKALGIDVDRIVITVAQLSVVALIILDAIFAYSVMSNKLRIHNVHCMAEGCRGYRIKDADNICSCLLRSVCKVYNIIILSLNWLAFIISMLLTFLVVFSSCIRRAAGSGSGSRDLPSACPRRGAPAPPVNTPLARSPRSSDLHHPHDGHVAVSRSWLCAPSPKTSRRLTGRSQCSSTACASWTTSSTRRPSRTSSESTTKPPPHWSVTTTNP